jgi:integrase/recombinase XerD
MSTLVKELDRYLAIRRSLGYDLSTSARVLRRFVAFAHSQGARYITTDLFLAWQAEFGQANQHHVVGAAGNGPSLCPLAERDQS